MRKFAVICTLTALAFVLLADSASACRGRRRARRCGPCLVYSCSACPAPAACVAPPHAGPAGANVLTDDRPPVQDLEQDLPPAEPADDEGSPSDKLDGPNLNEAAPATTE
jgi:hypothetical protein